MKGPVIEAMEIYPVAGRDSMLLNLSGAGPTGLSLPVPS